MTPRTKHCVTHWMTHSPSKLTHPLPSIEFIKHFSFASCWKPKTLHESRPTVTHVFSIKRFFNSRDIFLSNKENWERDDRRPATDPNRTLVDWIIRRRRNRYELSHTSERFSRTWDCFSLGRWQRRGNFSDAVGEKNEKFARFSWIFFFFW